MTALLLALLLFQGSTTPVALTGDTAATITITPAPQCASTVATFNIEPGTSFAPPADATTPDGTPCTYTISATPTDPACTVQGGGTVAAGVLAGFVTTCPQTEPPPTATPEPLPTPTPEPTPWPTATPNPTPTIAPTKTPSNATPTPPAETPLRLIASTVAEPSLDAGDDNGALFQALAFALANGADLHPIGHGA